MDQYVTFRELQKYSRFFKPIKHLLRSLSISQRGKTCMHSKIFKVHMMPMTKLLPKIADGAREFA